MSNESNIFLSIVSPVYKANDIVDELVLRISNTIDKINPNYEIILVDDGCPNNSWNAIQNACRQNKNVKGVKLSRNFGQHSAITAGLKLAQGEWIVVMDCDLQDQPEEIEKLLRKAEEGYDIVYAKREIRLDNYFKKQFSRMFYFLLGYLTDTKQDPEIANFGIYNKKVINAILELNDYVKYFPTMVKWVGFNSTGISVSHGSRYSGKTSYNFKGLLKLALNTILSFSDKPLRLTVKLGLLISCISFFYAIFNIYKYFTGKIEVLGYSSLIISIWFLAGIIITILGVLGLYIGKIFDQAKQRPTYIIDTIYGYQN